MVIILAWLRCAARKTCPSAMWTTAPLRTLVYPRPRLVWCNATCMANLLKTFKLHFLVSVH